MIRRYLTISSPPWRMLMKPELRREGRVHNVVVISDKLEKQQLIRVTVGCCPQATPHQDMSEITVDWVGMVACPGLILFYLVLGCCSPV